jgi:hypothetical protein
MWVSLGSLDAILGRLRVMQKPAGLRSAGFVLSRGLGRVSAIGQLVATRAYRFIKLGIGRRTAYAMLVILVLAVVWQVLGSP